MKTGIIILSAGNSSRLGSPKQLLKYKDTTLVQHTISAAEKSTFRPIVLVLGAHAEEILKSLQLQVKYLVNQNWEQGISTSITAGVKKILELNAECTDIIITVSDQPHISTAVFQALAKERLNNKKHIIASRYAQAIGTPVLFNKKYFEDLLSLQGHTGAKPILQKNTEDITTVPFELGDIDIDTQTDYNNLIKVQ